MLPVPAPLINCHVTAVVVPAFITTAPNCTVEPVTTVEGCGEICTDTGAAAGAAMVTVALADFVVSATEVALIAKAAGVGTAEGAA